MRHIRIQTDAIDTGAELARLESLPGGAVASFTGLVRDDNGLLELELEHYPGMTEAALAALVDTACARWPLLGVVLIHRIGPMRLGERIVLVGTASKHRAAALAACAFLIDRLKTDAPFWKREHFANGQSGWVEAKESDDDAAARWDK
ncbi:molybdenum cofactor biosynthesis protein MoaE [Aquisediminimonas sediminicola]|uniref:molybdenum cofactor biosynthesis protein MoaE n=1 Tax=Alteraquisediminimonas sediminicola TaxID=2676787 RepID=UPI001C8D268E|nr:molybdenum cofactor biosynthesis protein MoaE [Aquisediminimonas sediminicola]